MARLSRPTLPLLAVAAVAVAALLACATTAHAAPAIPWQQVQAWPFATFVAAFGRGVQHGTPEYTAREALYEVCG